MSQNKPTPDEVLAKFDMWQPISHEAIASREAQSHIVEALREALQQRDANLAVSAVLSRQLLRVISELESAQAGIRYSVCVKCNTVVESRGHE